MIKAFKQGLTEFGLNFNALINLIILTFVYFLGIGLSSIISKVMEKHHLDLKISKNRKSYWVKVDTDSKNISDFLRQY